MWWLLSNPSYGESCESMYACGSSVHQKCSNYALTNLLFGLCRFIWILNPLVIHFSPHLEVLLRPSHPQVLWTKERALTIFFVVFIFKLAFESFKKFGGASSTFVSSTQRLVIIVMPKFKSWWHDLMRQHSTTYR
jgi:hypothetical protein